MRSCSLLLLVGLGAGCVPKTGETEDVIVVENPEVSYEPIEDPNAIAEEAARRAQELADLLEQAPEEGVMVRVTDPGAEPRRALRYMPPLGHGEQARVTIDMNMNMNVAGMEIPMMMPVMVMDMDVEVTEVAEDGTITFSTAISSTSIQDKEGAMDGMAAAMEAQLASLTGLTSDMVMSATGEPIQLSFTAPEGASPEVQAQLQSANQSAQALSTPLPAEPVGLGATWEVFKRANSNGIGVVEHDTFKLVEMTDDTVTLEFTIAQHLADDDVAIPGLPPGTSVDVTGFESTGSGRVVVALTELSPRSGTSEVVLDMSMTIDAGAGPQDMNMKLDMAMGQGRPD